MVEETKSKGSADLFPLTHWSEIRPTGQTGCVNMEAVYEAYRVPLMLYLLCLGHKPEDSADLIQGFFAELLRRDSLSSVTPKKGRFRTFLISALKHYLNDQHDREHAAKRGGGQPLLSVDELLDQQGIDAAMVSQRGPDWAYDKAWANAILNAALRQLEEEVAKTRKRALFIALVPSMHQDTDAASYQEIADELGMTEGAVKVAAKRLRERLGQLIRKEVRQTLTNPSDFEAELQYLIELLRHA